MNDDEFQILLEERFITPDTNTPQRVQGFRSGHPQRPTILVEGAWYYPHELERLRDHDWKISSHEYDDTFFRCGRLGCAAQTNCRRGYPDPQQGGPCQGEF